MEIYNLKQNQEMISKFLVSNPPEKKGFLVEEIDWDNLKTKIQSLKKPRTFFAKATDICIGIFTTSIFTLFSFFPIKENFIKKPLIICTIFILLFTSLISAIVCAINSFDQKKQSEISINLLLDDMKNMELKGGRVSDKTAPSENEIS